MEPETLMNTCLEGTPFQTSKQNQIMRCGSTSILRAHQFRWGSSPQRETVSTFLRDHHSEQANLSGLSLWSITGELDQYCQGQSFLPLHGNKDDWSSMMAECSQDHLAPENFPIRSPTENRENNSNIGLTWLTVYPLEPARANWMQNVVTENWLEKKIPYTRKLFKD